MTNPIHYGLIRQDMTIIKIYWFESLDFVKEKLKNYNEGNQATGFKLPLIKIFALTILEE